MASQKKKKQTNLHYSPAFLKLWKEVQDAVEAEGQITDAVRKLFRDGVLRLGHEERVRNLYRINGKLTNSADFFVPNKPQSDFLEFHKGRDIVLKSRQIGMTTLSGVRGLDYALWEPNSKCGIMAHQQNTVTTIFNDIVKFSYTWFLRDWGQFYRPNEKAASRTDLAFTDDGLGRPLESSMRVLFDFRGKTVNFLHVSEASRVEDERLLGSLQGVPANGQVIYESTPQGRAGDFYRQWQNWRNLKTLAPYQGFFVPWFEFYPERPEDWSLPEGTQLSAYERTLMEESGGRITESHIAWRRWCIEANCQGDSEKFENEYPSNDRDAFFTGDAQVFPQSILKAQSTHVRPPTREGFLISEGPAKISFMADRRGAVAIWDEPEQHRSYVIGADPSGGVGKDAGAAYVLCQQTGRFVARLWGQFTPDDFAGELIKLATYYNKAWICPEANNHGHVVIHVLKQRGYGNVYKRRALDDAGKILAVPGFLTTNESKLVLTEKLKGSLRSGRLVVYDDALLSELSSFVQVASKGSRTVRREASSGAHDDLVMAAAFAEEMNAARPAANHTTEALAAPSPDGDEETYLDSETGFAVG